MKLASLFNKNLVCAVLVAFTSTASVSVAHAADDKKVIKWKVQSHWPSASSSYKDSLTRLKTVIEERTGGRLELTLYEDGALFKAKEIFPAVSRNIVQMGTISPAYVQDKMSLAGIASGLPFSFRNVWEAAYFHKNLGFEDMLRKEAAVHGVYYSTDKVYPTEMVVKNPINSVADFNKLKVRSSGVLQKFLTDAGAAASYLPGSELYTALSSGVVDGAHWGAAQGANSMSLYEVAKHHVKPALNIAGTDAFIISQKALDALPADVRKIVLQALDEQFWFRTNEYEFQENVTLAKAIKEKGVKVNTLPKEVQDRMAKAAQKTWQEEGKRSPNAAEAMKKLNKFMAELGYL